MIDSNGFRKNIGIILIGPRKHILLAKRYGQDAWQFPQGGIKEHESLHEAMYRELKEEIGLQQEDVKIIRISKRWLSYRLPEKLIRYDQIPLCIGQKQKWFLLKLISDEQKIQLNLSDPPEFDSWRWVDYWFPLKEVIYFKQQVYRRVLNEFKGFVK